MALSGKRKQAIRSKLIDWYRANKRKLPWRDDPSPYHIWISEIMAQQTRIAALLDHYEKFLKRFPDVETLARSPLDDVLALWSGLGYYSRARNLHKAAKVIVNEYGGEIPSDPQKLIKLPGIGRYTAGAISSIAYDVATPILDGNVMRVFSRIEDMDEDIARPATQKHLWQMAGDLVKGSGPGDLNQALMELGALVCIPGVPNCQGCPLKSHCKARRVGTTAIRPVKAKKKAPIPLPLIGIVIRDSQGRLLMVQNPASGLFAGLWQIPVFPPDFSPGKKQKPEAMLKDLENFLGKEIRSFKKLGIVLHTLSHRRIEMVLVECDVDVRGLKPEGYKEKKWITGKNDIENLGLASFMQKTLEAINFPAP